MLVLRASVYASPTDWVLLVLAVLLAIVFLVQVLVARCVAQPLPLLKRHFALVGLASAVLIAVRSPGPDDGSDPEPGAHLYSVATLVFLRRFHLYLFEYAAALWVFYNFAALHRHMRRAVPPTLRRSMLVGGAAFGSALLALDIYLLAHPSSPSRVRLRLAADALCVASLVALVVLEAAYYLRLRGSISAYLADRQRGLVPGLGLGHGSIGGDFMRTSSASVLLKDASGISRPSGLFPTTPRVGSLPSPAARPLTTPNTPDFAFERILSTTHVQTSPGPRARALADRRHVAPPLTLVERPVQALTFMQAARAASLPLPLPSTNEGAAAITPVDAAVEHGARVRHFLNQQNVTAGVGASAVSTQPATPTDGPTPVWMESRSQSLPPSPSIAQPTPFAHPPPLHRLPPPLPTAATRSASISLLAPSAAGMVAEGGPSPSPPPSSQHSTPSPVPPRFIANAATTTTTTSGVITASAESPRMTAATAHSTTSSWSPLHRLAHGSSASTTQLMSPPLTHSHMRVTSMDLGGLAGLGIIPGQGFYPSNSPQIPPTRLSTKARHLLGVSAVGGGLHEVGGSSRTSETVGLESRMRKIFLFFVATLVLEAIALAAFIVAMTSGDDDDTIEWGRAIDFFCIGACVILMWYAWVLTPSTLRLVRRSHWSWNPFRSSSARARGVHDAHALDLASMGVMSSPGAGVRKNSRIGLGFGLGGLEDLARERSVVGSRTNRAGPPPSPSPHALALSPAHGPNASPDIGPQPLDLVREGEDATSVTRTLDPDAERLHEMLSVVHSHVDAEPDAEPEGADATDASGATGKDEVPSPPPPPPPAGGRIGHRPSMSVELSASKRDAPSPGTSPLAPPRRLRTHSAGGSPPLGPLPAPALLVTQIARPSSRSPFFGVAASGAVGYSARTASSTLLASPTAALADDRGRDSMSPRSSSTFSSSATAAAATAAAHAHEPHVSQLSPSPPPPFELGGASVVESAPPEVASPPISISRPQVTNPPLSFLLRAESPTPVVAGAEPSPSSDHALARRPAPIRIVQRGPASTASAHPQTPAVQPPLSPSPPPLRIALRHAPAAAPTVAAAF